MIRIRRDHAVYKDGNYRLLAARDGLFAFTRTKEISSISSHTTKRLRLVTATNCGQQQQTLPLLGAWKDLLSGFQFMDDVIVLPGQAMILEPAEEA